jgi:transcriptional regulator with XRE-family HTH domain
MLRAMVPATAILNARHAAGLTQAELARRAGTSQATISAYESGRKRPSVATLARVLEAAGARLSVEPAPAVAERARLARNGRVLEEVLALADALPSRHAPALRYPRLVA